MSHKIDKISIWVWTQDKNDKLKLNYKNIFLIH